MFKHAQAEAADEGFLVIKRERDRGREKIEEGKKIKEGKGIKGYGK